MKIPQDLGKIEFLRDHPAILEKLVERSKSKSLNSFIENNYSSIFTGGFNWENSEEGEIFWRTILQFKNVEKFYELYPRKLYTKSSDKKEISIRGREGEGEKVISTLISLGFSNLMGWMGGTSSIFYGGIPGEEIKSSFRPIGTLLTIEEAKKFLEEESNQTISKNIIMSTTKTTNGKPVYKTETLTINGQEREITVATLISEGRVRTGYAVRLPEDKKDPAIALTIATGRALSDKTNLTPEMYIGQGMDTKWVLYAVVENMLKRIERGVVTIKGIK